ncbi:MAG: alpha/beta hydrolase [Planctomycetes bacterium]|nr:alpha/beta hydrolase [Planctomycetota bacterium]
MRRRVLIFLSVAAGAWLLLTFALWLLQDRIVFPGAWRGHRPVDVSGVRTFELAGAAGPFRVAERAPERPRAVLLFFVGNGEDLASAARRAAGFARHGLLVIAPEYPGYGGSAGEPGVASLHDVALRTAEYAAGIATARGLPLVVGGISLGSFCAVRVAAEREVARLFLAAPPTNLVDAARARFWWLPIGLLLRHRFDSTAIAPQVQCPVLVVHGDADAIVPIALGERLAAAFANAEFVRVPAAGHNDLPLEPGNPVGDRIGRFLRGD